MITLPSNAEDDCNDLAIVSCYGCVGMLFVPSSLLMAEKQ